MPVAVSKDESTAVQYQLTEDTIKSEGGQSISMDEKIAAISSMTEEIDLSSSTATITSSATTASNSSSGNEYDLKRSDQIPSHLDTDNSSKRLISEEESSKQNEEFDADDQVVTTDLTLTKTVEPTEYDPEPESDPKINVPAQPIIIINNENNNDDEEKDDDDIVREPAGQEQERVVEDPIDNMKEMSHNFESTMDDISDAELESLEQELDDLVAAAIIENNLEKVSEESVVKSLEESIEKTIEIEEEKVAIEDPDNDKKEITEIGLENTPAENVVAIEEEKIEIAKAEKVNERTEEESAKSETVEEVQAVSSTIVETEQPESISEAHEATEPSSPQIFPTTDPDPAISTSSTDESTSIQNLPSQSNDDYSVNESNSTGSLTSQPDLGKVPPYWIPDNMTNQCMQCDQKFSLIKRRHHCRACGLLLCAGCCNEKFFLHYLQGEGRICSPCHEILLKAQQHQQQHQPKNPNPANPSEYCSTVPVQQQVSSAQPQPITVMVPTPVLKRTSGSRSTERKSVIFSDGIRPGTDLDDTVNSSTMRSSSEKSKYNNLPTLNEKNNSFIPESANDLPPILVKDSDFKYVDNNLTLLQRLRQEELKFAINKNFYVTVKIVTCE